MRDMARARDRVRRNDSNRPTDTTTGSEGKIPFATVHLKYTEEAVGQTTDNPLFWLMDDGKWRTRCSTQLAA